MKWLLMAFVAFLIALGAATTVAVPWTLVTGWAPFLGRVLPRVTIDGRTAIFGIAAFVLFTAGIHWFGRSAYRPTDGRRWRTRLVVGRSNDDRCPIRRGNLFDRGRSPDWLAAIGR